MSKAMKILVSVTLGLGVVSPAVSHAQEKRVASLQKIAQSNLRFIAESQVRRADGVYVPGEWRAQIHSSLIPVLVGVGNPFGVDEEPSAFTTGSIMNQLATIYREHPEFKEIPSMLAKAAPSLERFREGYLYNFYPPRTWRGVRVHQASTMKLSPIWKGFTNIPEDADTSSVTYTAKHLTAQTQGRPFEVPAPVYRSLSRFRDIKRRPHSFNEDQRMINTGAFLTWQYDENDPRMPTFYFAEPEEGKRIPFNRNDVDCIVNLNVLRMLAETRHSDIKGRDKSCGLLGYIVLSEDYAQCGMYYPQTYNFHYSASLADEAGEKCLRPYADRMVEYILRTQYGDGGWYNIGNKHVEDRTHATAFAMYALAQFGDAKDGRVRSALARGTRFLMGRMARTQSGLHYWQGEVFFTATALARSLVDWKSDVFTTTSVLAALLKADQVLATQP